MIATRSPRARFLRRWASAAALGMAYALTAAPRLGAADPAPAVTLFNGRNLDGWYVVVHDKGVVADHTLYQVNGDMIHAYKDAPDRSEQPSAGLITTAEYGDYRLTLQYKWGAKKFAPRAGPDNVRDAGVCYHVRGPDVIWPTGVECQIQEGDTGDVWLINTQATSTVHPDNLNYVTPSDGGVEVTRGFKPKGFNRFLRSNCFETDGWNTVEVTVRGDSAVYRINGHVNNRITKMKYWDESTAGWQPLTRGKILLQAEFAEVFYRDITLQPLDAVSAP